MTHRNLALLPPILSNYADGLALDIWHRYATTFKLLLGLDERVCDYLGAVGADVGMAEFKVHGPSYYETSIAAPVRNSWYCARTANTRWHLLQEHSLIPPILDYGCGVGFTLVWLAEKGYDPTSLYGWDLPGIQRQVAQSTFDREGIQWWDESAPTTFGTILCLNTLEHIPDAPSVLSRLRSMSSNIIANCDVHPGGDHVLSPEVRESIVRDLIENGHHIGVKERNWDLFKDQVKLARWSRQEYGQEEQKPI